MYVNYQYLSDFSRRFYDLYPKIRCKGTAFFSYMQARVCFFIKKYLFLGLQRGIQLVHDRYTTSTRQVHNI